MPFVKGIEIMGSLSQALVDKYEGVTPLDALMVPLKEGDVTLHMISDNLMTPVFQINGKKQIEVFPGGMRHFNDCNEARRYHKALLERHDKDWADRKRHYEKELREQRKAARNLKRQIDEIQSSTETSGLRLGHASDQLVMTNRRIDEAKQKLGELATRPKRARARNSYMALVLNAPIKIGLGELGRVVFSLRERVIKELGVMPRKSECSLDRMIRIEVTWK